MARDIVEIDTLTPLISVPQLAMTLKGGGIVLFELFPESSSLFGTRTDGRRATRRGPRGEVYATPSSSYVVAFYGRDGDAEGPDGLSSGEPRPRASRIFSLKSLE
jgi:hypothetical protein